MFGGKINHQNVYGEAPLIWASSHGHIDIVRHLLKHKADVTLRNKYNVTALIEAANLGNAEIVKTLLKGGARVGDPEKGRTAVHYAAKKGYNHVVRIFHDEPKRLAHREKRIRFGVQLCRAMMYKSSTSLPISPVHMGIRKFFDKNSRLRWDLAERIACMHPALHEDFKFVPRELPKDRLSSLSPQSENYGKRRRRRRKHRKKDKDGNPIKSSSSRSASASASAAPAAQSSRRNTTSGSSSGKKKKKKKKKGRRNTAT